MKNIPASNAERNQRVVSTISQMCICIKKQGDMKKHNGYTNRIIAQKSRMKDSRCRCTLWRYRASGSQVHAADAEANPGGARTPSDPVSENYTGGHFIQRIQMCFCVVV